MKTAGLRVVEGPTEHSPRRKRHGRNRPPMPLRPLHRMWRRTIDEIEIVRVDLPVRHLNPALSGIVACQISDFHLDRDEDVARLEQAVKAINRQKPEFVFLTGDYFSGPATMRFYIEPFRRALADLTPSTGVFAIPGNHDHWSSINVIVDALDAAGVRVLANEHERVNVRGEKLVVVGIDDLWSRRAEPARAFRGVTRDDCTIVLAHNPDTALYTRHLEPGVMLCGHTHGGVVRIPFYGSVINSILRIGKQYYAGLNRYGEFYIYTNRGLGTFWLRIRINCRPEISRFRLNPLTDDQHTHEPPPPRNYRRHRRRRSG
ncbi:MAG TPA: metallophosphoesterase [Candidatus Binataceae bacterium]|nr:metallophosphoesterase [Candidatus Binataceae bacterium]